MTSRLTVDSIIVATREQLSTELSGETVILHLTDGVYYGLDPVGTLVWRALDEPRPVSALVELVIGRYEVAPEQCARDLLALLEEMAGRGLVSVVDAPAR